MRKRIWPAVMLAVVVAMCFGACGEETLQPTGNQPVAVASVKVTKSHLGYLTVDAAEGETKTVELTATVSPKNATEKALTWEVVSGAGCVELSAAAGEKVTATAKAKGIAKVVAVAGGKRSAETEIEVRVHEASNVFITRSANVPLEIDGTVVFTAACLPEEAAADGFLWHVVGGEGIVELSSDTGAQITVTGKAVGAVELYATCGTMRSGSEIVDVGEVVRDTVKRIDGYADDWADFAEVPAACQSTVPERYNFQSMHTPEGLYILAVQHVNTLVEGLPDPTGNTHFIVNGWGQVLEGWTPYGLFIDFYADSLHFFCYNDEHDGERTDADGNVIDYSRDYEYVRRTVDNGAQAEYRFTVVYEAFIAFPNGNNDMYLQYYFKSYGEELDIPAPPADSLPAGVDPSWFPAREGVIDWSDSCKSYHVTANGIAQRMFT